MLCLRNLTLLYLASWHFICLSLYPASCFSFSLTGQVIFFTPLYMASFIGRRFHSLSALHFSVHISVAKLHHWITCTSRVLTVYVTGYRCAIGMFFIVIVPHWNLVIHFSQIILNFTCCYFWWLCFNKILFWTCHSK